jgi:hypothetical protein
MAVSRKEVRGMGAYAAPLLGVFLLITCYLVLADWNELPTIIDSAISAVHWPV